MADRAEPLALLAARLRAQAAEPLLRVAGTVTGLDAGGVHVAGLGALAAPGDLLGLDSGLLCEVIGTAQGRVTAQPLTVERAVTPGALAQWRGPPVLRPHAAWRGRVMDALCRPLDGKGELLQGDAPRGPDAAPPPAAQRARVTTPLRAGVRAVDLFTPLCIGQRMGLFAGSGVGKSTLLGMMAGADAFGTVVVALVGERGREVRDLLEGPLAPAMPRTIAVVATGDESAGLRRLAPRTAMAIAEYFRDRGENVLIAMDSVTRYAHAAREIALTRGEPPVARGYTPGIFADLPRLLERAGPGVPDADGRCGSITGLFAVLVDGDDHNDPVADCIRGTLDGHIVLDRALAARGRYPALDPLASLSRLTDRALDAPGRALHREWRRLVARFEEGLDLRAIAGHRPGQDADLDRALALVPKLYEFLNQQPGEAGAEDVMAQAAALLAG